MEEIIVVYEDEDVRVEHIVSNGAISPPGFWYDQDEYEEATVIRGEAQILTENGPINLRAGLSIRLPAHCKHRITHTTPDCEWRCVFHKNKVAKD